MSGIGHNHFGIGQNNGPVKNEKTEGHMFAYIIIDKTTAKAASLVGVEVGCPPVAAAAGWAGGPRAPLVQVWLLADELTRAPARHVVPHPRRGHGHTILNSKHRLILCPLFLTWFPSVPPLLGWFSLQFV